MGCEKKIRVGINGARGVGLLIIWYLLSLGDNYANSGCSVPDLAVINDPSISIKNMALLLNNLLPWRQEHVFEVKNENTLQFGQKSISVLAVSNPAEIPWAWMKVEYVIESTGLFTGKAKAAGHLEGGAKKVIITDISKDAPMYVFGVNEEKYEPEYDNIVSSASYITHHLAPILEVLHDSFRIRGGDIKILDSTIATQYDDGPIMTDGGDGRLAFLDLISKVTRSASAAGRLIQILNNRFGIFGGLMPAVRTTSTVIDVINAAGELLLNVGNILGIDDLRTTLIKLPSSSAAINTIDGPHGASSTGIIPADVEAVEKVLAYLQGKLTGTVSHGATMDISIVELTVRLEVEATLEDIKAAIKEASEEKFKGILAYTEGDHSRDLLDDRRSSIFNGMPTACSALNNNEFKFIFCCHKKWGYGCRVIDLILHMHSVQA